MVNGADDVYVETKVHVYQRTPIRNDAPAPSRPRQELTRLNLPSWYQSVPQVGPSGRSSGPTCSPRSTPCWGASSWSSSQSGRHRTRCSAPVLVANTAIGIFQELRAKRTLDRLAVLTAPRGPGGPGGGGRGD